MHEFVLNVYFWGEPEQNRLLTECVGPAARELWEEGALGRFWFDRFDARGPHVTLLLSAPSARRREVEARLRARIEAYLAAAPSSARPEPGVLERRHTECRGKHLCSLDLLAGIAANNTVHVADDTAGEYVMRPTAGMEPASVYPLLGDLALWSIDQLRRGSTTAVAVRWAAGLSGALERAGADSAEYWQYYAATLVLSLRNSITGSDPAVLAGLPRLVGERNRQVMDRLWDAGAPPVWPGMDRLARLIVSAGAPDDERRLFVRELVHATLAQLGQYVMFRIPLSLYAWDRTRAPALAAA